MLTREEVLADFVGVDDSIIERIKVEGITQYKINEENRFWRRCLVLEESEREKVAHREIENRLFTDWWDFDVSEISTLTGVSEEEVERRVGQTSSGIYSGSELEEFIQSTVGKKKFRDHMYNKFENDLGALLNVSDNEEYQHKGYYIYYFA